MSSVWSVDDLEPDDLAPRDAARRYLVRLNRLTEDGPGGLRYLLADAECIDLRASSSGDSSPSISYGLAYRLDDGALRESSTPTTRGSSEHPLPFLTPENLTRCLERAPAEESELREEMRTLFEEAEPPVKSPSIESSEGIDDGLSSAMRIHVVNVGQGDTIILEFPGRRLWFIDAYFWRKAKYEQFKAMLTATVPGYTVDRVVVSHFHYDHIRSMMRVIDDFDPGEVVVTDSLIHTTGAARNLLRHARVLNKLRVLRKRERTKQTGITLRMVRTADFPGEPTLGTDPNEHAICVVCTTKHSVVLLAADIPGQLLARLTSSSLLRSRAAYRLYKVTHHCSRTGDDASFLRAFPAHDSVTSCGRSNRYGHPHDPPDRKLGCVGNHWKTSEDGRLLLTLPVM